MVIALASSTTALAVLLLLRAVSERPRSERRSVRVDSWLASSELDVTPFQFWASSIGAGVVTFLVVYAITSLFVVSIMPAIVVAALPRAYFGRKRAQRLLEIQEAWPDGLRDLISTVRSGGSLPMAVSNLATFGPGPLRVAFASFPVYSKSLGFVAALEMVKADLADPTSDRVVEVLILAHERGGSVVPEILSDLAEATTKDVWTLEQIRTEALEQKINSRVVFVLPWIVLVAMTAQSGAFREFYSSPAGIAVAVVGGLMSLLGIAVAARLGTQRSEPRVVTSGRGPE